MGIRQNDELRLNWVADLLQLTAEQLVFVDETLFNETTGWRHQAYAPVGEPARYQASRKRGHSWSVLPAYTIDGYLPCTGIREGWFNGEAFFAVLELPMICPLELRGQLALAAAPAVFALAAASTMVLAAASALALRAASALPEGFNLDEVLEGMSESSRGSF